MPTIAFIAILFAIIAYLTLSGPVLWFILGVLGTIIGVITILYSLAFLFTWLYSGNTRNNKKTLFITKLLRKLRKRKQPISVENEEN
ncbi:hypothetical protein [Bacillus thuringiensis]|uniref:hypothetical protein n=1 Tax=Bacillus thuringiensis TaxID=1428 RepID=UPI0021D66990|nr:hypothetical protein [Bacillus thuringiensis]MCU7667833.1 hypothetical protein [Bacillus thuringiensis]